MKSASVASVCAGSSSSSGGGGSREADRVTKHAHTRHPDNDLAE